MLLLEAGPDYGAFAEGRWPADLLEARTIPVSHDWGYTSGDELPGRELAYERARVIGGCSAHNGCTVSWGHRADYDGWAARGLEGWSADDLLPLFDEASARMRVRRFTDDEVAPFHREFVEAGAAMGLDETDDLDTLDGMSGVCIEPSNSPDGVRWNAAFAYLDPVRGASRAHDPRRHARRSRDRRGRPRGRGARGRSRRAVGAPRRPRRRAARASTAARRSCCAAASGPPDELRALGIDALVDLPVGRNLHDHPSFELTSRRATSWRGAPPRSRPVATSCPTSRDSRRARAGARRPRASPSTCTCSRRSRWMDASACSSRC